MNRKIIFKFSTRISVFFIVTSMIFLSPFAAMACGYGNAGGRDYIPQRQAPYAGGNQTTAAIDQEKAKNIVMSHVNKLNPNLEIGTINDAGGFFEVEITNKAKEVVQMLGVDKYSGRLMLLN